MKNIEKLSQSAPKKDSYPIKIPWWVIVPTLLMILASVIVPWIVIPRIDLAKLGQFGDMYGSINALIAIMGFAGLFWSLHLQREQFKVSLQDMTENAEASRELAKAAHEQAQALLEQNRLTRDQIESQKIALKVQILSSRLSSIDAGISAMIESPKATMVIFNPNDPQFKAMQDMRTQIHSELLTIIESN